MAGQSSILTDYNPGSIIRTIAEGLGSVVELQGVSEQTLAFQAMIYGTMAAFGVVPLGATSATGLVIFTAPGPATQAVSIPVGTLLSTNGGVQFSVVSGVALASGASMVQTTVQAVSGGTGGNVAASGITQILSGLGYPFTVLNPLPTAGGANAETLAGTLARFAAAVAAPGLCSLVAVANGAIGITVGTERVLFSNCYEGWIAAGSGIGSGQAGFTLYIDDGTGSASSGLIAAVDAAISGNPGFRPVGVPFRVASTAPVFASVSVSGAMIPAYDNASGTTAIAISNAIINYAGSLPISGTLYAGNLAAVVGTAGEGQLASFTVSLSGSAGSGLSSVSAPFSGRVILSTLNINIT